MLSQQTVFIIGAGASAPYGFSTGMGQLNAARALSPEQVAAKISPISQTKAPALVAELAQTGEYSIDAMLPADSPLLPAAKAYIARDLFMAEYRDRTPRGSEEHWYRTLFANIPRRSYNEAVNAPVRIFTFNYERSLDDFLLRGFTQRLGSGATPQQIAQLLAQLGPFHLHGQLGRLIPELPGNDAVVPYGGSDDSGPTDAEMMAATQQVKLISETRATDFLFQSFHSELARAERVVFLGFGFHAENVAKLRLKDCLRQRAVTYASAKGITDQQMAHFMQRYEIPRMTFGREDWTVSRYLDMNPRILD